MGPYLMNLVRGLFTAIGRETIKDIAAEEGKNFLRTLFSRAGQRGIFGATMDYGFAAFGRRTGSFVGSRFNRMGGFFKNAARPVTEPSAAFVKQQLAKFAVRFPQTAAFASQSANSRLGTYLRATSRRFLVDAAVQVTLNKISDEIDQLEQEYLELDKTPDTAAEERKLEIIERVNQLLNTFFAVLAYTLAGKARGKRATDFNSVPLTDNPTFYAKPEFREAFRTIRKSDKKLIGALIYGKQLTGVISSYPSSILFERVAPNSQAALRYYRANAFQALGQVTGAAAAISLFGVGGSAQERLTNAAIPVSFRAASGALRLTKAQARQLSLFNVKKATKPRKTKKVAGV